MVSVDSCLIDSNILVRMSNEDDPQFPAVTSALRTLLGQGIRLCYTSQNLGEFWNVSTRPVDKNGLGLSVPETADIAAVIESKFTFLADSRETHERWRALLIAHDIKGVQVHDARLAAAMYIHGAKGLLTMNGRDFKRFDGLEVIHPRIPI